MGKGGHRRKVGRDWDAIGYDWSHVKSNSQILDIMGAEPVRKFIETQQLKWLAHIVRRPNNSLIKMLTFNSEPNSRTHPAPSILRQVTQRAKNLDVSQDKLFTLCREKAVVSEFHKRNRS